MARRKRVVVASLLAIAGGVAGCSNLASLGVGFTADPVGIQITIKTTADVPTYTIVDHGGAGSIIPATLPAAAASTQPGG